MKKQIFKDKESDDDKSFRMVWLGVGLTICAFIGASAFSFDGPVVLVPSTHADSLWPLGPADWQTAQRYGVIDHSSLNSPDVLPEPNLPPQRLLLMKHALSEYEIQNHLDQRCFGAAVRRTGFSNHVCGPRI